MLPATFEKEPDLRASQAAIGIIAVALLTAGFSLSGLLCFANRNPLFQNDSVLIPCLSSCLLGLGTVFYSFIVFKRYAWNTPAVLTAVAAAFSITVYASLTLWTYHRIKKIKINGINRNNPIAIDHSRLNSDTALWQNSSYYENYSRNMWPTARPRTPPPVVYEQNSITEEEMQRQQMLMLLLQTKPPETHDASSSTFHVDWQVRDDEDAPPTDSYYAPGVGQPSTAYTSPRPGMIRQFSYELGQNLQPWDGVWRTPARVQSTAHHPRATTPADRHARQQQIEQNLQ